MALKFFEKVDIFNPVFQSSDQILDIKDTNNPYKDTNTFILNTQTVSD